MPTIIHNKTDDTFTMSRDFFGQFVNSLADSLAKSNVRVSEKMGASADNPTSAMDSAASTSFFERFPDAARLTNGFTLMPAPKPIAVAQQPAVTTSRAGIHAALTGAIDVARPRMDAAAATSFADRFPDADRLVKGQ